MGARLTVRDLSVTFRRERDSVFAVTDVSFGIAPGEIVGLVGESGCGKSVTTKAILKLIDGPNVTTGGEVLLDDENLLLYKEARMRQVRGKRISLISQNPLSSLNPVLTIGDQVAEPLIQHYKMSKKEALRNARSTLDSVGFPKGDTYLKRYANEFSGGMRQRIAIAMALVGEPDLIIADEPTTALDVTIQAQILNLLKDIVARTGTSLLLITHDLAVVAEMCDKIGVMYAGQMVEWGTKRQVLTAPRHPYTEALLSAVPDKGGGEGFVTIPGQPPKLNAIPDHCHFADRCRYAEASCRAGIIGFESNAEGRGVRCLKPLRRSLS
ncbi:ABC transporter ATP-binding protein [Paenibacillaceae bacterium WGS1546]|uniref:ABC transporter ATP-binding protein n=1 Tax=Cohnella sp. WGS1546 TaxID=3366810 RepID=UPI00372D6EEC